MEATKQRMSVAEEAAHWWVAMQDKASQVERAGLAGLVARVIGACSRDASFLASSCRTPALQTPESNFRLGCRR